MEWGDDKENKLQLKLQKNSCFIDPMSRDNACLKHNKINYETIKYLLTILNNLKTNWSMK